MEYLDCTSTIVVGLIAIAYFMYWKYYSFYKIEDPLPQGLRNKLRRGKCPPSYPNGWYRIGRSDELKPGEVHEAKFAGRHMVYYRGYDKIAYALHAYCPHMGANLGFGGKVKNIRCLECPFHGWRFDGKDGKLVAGNTFEGQKVSACEYHDIDEMTKEEKYIKCGKEQEVHVKKYITRELNNIVYVWLHAISVQPLYEPFKDDIQNFTLRGESINYVNCHMQEIPENGADMKHFGYLHFSIASMFDRFIKFRWTMKTKNASDPNFYKEMTHSNAKVREYQSKLFVKYLESDPKRKQILNVLSLDAEIIFFNKYSFYFLTTTGFQTGPATVSLYLRSILFEAIYQQAIQPVDKFTQKVYHTLYMNSVTPYWLSAYALYGELRQVVFDTLVWNTKIFSDKICYNMKSEADRALFNWRNWYSQFYEGAHEFEQKLDRLEW